jgi:glycosyltransferase involved in cell wall biosynthesis
MPSSHPLVTIVTPSYNQGGFIRSTIESVLAQDYPEIEYIVMDGGSTDQTASVVAGYAGRLTWISEKDRGQAHAINKGFQLARGEIVAWVNSDDLLLPAAVTRAVAALEAAPSVGAIYGDGLLMNREGEITGPFRATEPFNLWKLVHLSDYVLQQSTFFRRAAIEDIGWLDESLVYTMDWDLLIRLGKRFGLCYVPGDFGVLREYPDAKSFSGGFRRIKEIGQMLERHTGLKRAPGFWSYGLDTCLWLFLNRHEPVPRWLALPAKLLKSGASFVIEFPLAWLRDRQGIFPDRWASDRLLWMLPCGPRDVVIRGIVPDHPRLSGQTLTVVAPDGALGVWDVGPGAFEISFRTPARSGPLSIEIRAARYRRPEFFRRPVSFRRMAFILESVDF